MRAPGVDDPWRRVCVRCLLKRSLRCLAFLLPGLLALAASGGAAHATQLRVMTFNIRFDFKSDGGNRWDKRADAVAETIERSGAQVVCLQEDKRHQVEDLQKRLRGYAFLGRGRNANGTGEHCAILFDRKALRLRDNGSFWLSDTPRTPGSNTFGDKYPRVVTWGLFEAEGKRRLLVLNAHLVEGKRDRIRRQGAEVIRDWLIERLGLEKKTGGERALSKLALVVAGDFNDDAGTDLQRVLTGAEELGLVDAWEAGSPTSRWPGTFNGFKGLKTRQRIDWILAAGAVRVGRCGKIDEKVQDRWPSDHYPVWADLMLQ
jgi:endonuclease/exonuclease/phosphatase family metal-dependent hydrolase